MGCSNVSSRGACDDGSWVYGRLAEPFTPEAIPKILLYLYPLIYACLRCRFHTRLKLGSS